LEARISRANVTLIPCGGGRLGDLDRQHTCLSEPFPEEASALGRLAPTFLRGPRRKVVHRLKRTLQSRTLEFTVSSWRAVIRSLYRRYSGILGSDKPSSMLAMRRVGPHPHLAMSASFAWLAWRCTSLVKGLGIRSWKNVRRVIGGSCFPLPAEQERCAGSRGKIVASRRIRMRIVAALAWVEAIVQPRAKRGGPQAQSRLHRTTLMRCRRRRAMDRIAAFH